VVWIPLGNCSTEEIESLLRSDHESLLGFDRDEESSFLVLG
jgi:predicted nuclease of predicted toxin-antitoxin system